MELIWWIQTLLPPSLIVGVFPLIIIGCWLLAFGEWLYPRWRSAGLTYALSLLTVPFSHRVANLDLPESAIIGGIVVPAICGLLLVVSGSLRTLNSPSHFAGSRRSVRFHAYSTTWLGRGLLGIGIGGVLGLSLGLLFSLLVLALLSLLNVLAIYPTADGANDSLITAVLDGGIYTFGILGVVLGGCIGLDWLNLPQIHQRLLISAVICSALMMRTARRLFQIPYLADSMRLQVIERPHTLTLRCRVYRSSDWVWMGFNSLYDALTICIIVVALLRGTWAMLSLGLGLITVIALIWTWHSLTRLFNHTTIILEPTALHRWDEPLFSFKLPVRLAVQEIMAVTASTASQRSKLKSPFASTEYQICAILVNGKRIPLIQRIDRWEEALWVEEAIEQFLASSVIRE
ncbi:hypothetical protein [Egbenema bharatensis]|uniref:hypothetical protein n=1 Tax=Egbenema bharatensis TaxID=3463334 RepID=UPI003A8C37ED